MATIVRFEDIDAWKTARVLTNLIYECSKLGEFSKDYGLRDQIRRASVSIMSNIAEGFESQTQAMFIKYLGLAKASAGELRSQLYIAHDLEYIPDELYSQLFELARKVSGQIYGFASYLRSRPNSRRVSDIQNYSEQLFDSK